LQKLTDRSHCFHLQAAVRECDRTARHLAHLEQLDFDRRVGQWQ
jgi:hypothetical protein